MKPSGGTIPPRKSDGDTVPVRLSPAEEITDPDRAEQLGLTVDARRMRAQQATCAACEGSGWIADESACADPEHCASTAPCPTCNPNGEDRA